MLLSQRELKDVLENVYQIILSSGITAKVLRASADDLYGPEETAHAEIAIIPIDMTETPPEDISRNIDATVSVLPSEDVKENDHLVIGDHTYRAQSVENAYFFGIITHKIIKLVKLHERT